MTGDDRVRGSRLMAISICRACGTSYAEANGAPDACRICLDPRQFVPRSGQAWTTPDELGRCHANVWDFVEPNLLSIHTIPDFAIGQRAMIVRTQAGNFLWDCIALLDEATIELVHALGGLAGIAISHPHYYTRCQDWAVAFGCPVHLHAADREWIVRPSPSMQFWEGDELVIAPGLTVIRLGGHFPGSAVLHWLQESGEGVLLTGDTVQVSADPCAVSFMWSYPNRIPLSAATVRRIADRLGTWRIDRLHGFGAGCEITDHGNTVIQRSARTYIDSLSTDR